MLDQLAHTPDDETHAAPASSGLLGAGAGAGAAVGTAAIVANLTASGAVAGAPSLISD